MNLSRTAEVERARRGVSEGGDEVTATMGEIMDAAQNGDLYWCDEHDCYHIVPDHEFKGVKG